MNKPRFIANIVIIIILLSIIVATAESDDDDDDDWWDTGDTIIWPAEDPYHMEWNDQIIYAPGGGSDTDYTYKDHDFDVRPNATRGVIICGNFTNLGMEDVDIEVKGVDGDVIVSAATQADPEVIHLEGTPDPTRIDHFDQGSVGTWTVRVYNYLSIYSFVIYDLSVDIYYDGAEYYPSGEE